MRQSAGELIRCEEMIMRQVRCGGWRVGAKVRVHRLTVTLYSHAVATFMVVRLPESGRAKLVLSPGPNL